MATINSSRNLAQTPARTRSAALSSLRLQGRRWFIHFFAALLLGVLPLTGLVALLQPPVDATAAWSVIGMTGVLAALAAIMARRQRRALWFRRIRTQRTAAENYELVLRGMKPFGWVITTYRRNQRIEAKTPGFPATWLSWGEMVTVRFSGEDVLVNSICDPDAQSSVVSWGRNRKNTAAVAELLDAKYPPE